MGHFWSHKYNEQYDFAQASNEKMIYKAGDELSGRDVPHILKNVSVLSHLSDRQIAKLIKCMTIRRYKSNEIICKQGDVGDNFYLICKGQVNVLIQDAQHIGQQRKVAVLKTGDTFGERALITNDPMNATVQCEAYVKVLYADKLTFLQAQRGGDDARAEENDEKELSQPGQGSSICSDLDANVGVLATVEGMKPMKHQSVTKEMKDEDVSPPLSITDPDPHLLQKLQEFGLSKWYLPLNQKLGVETLGDLQYCLVQDFESIGCKPMHIRKLQAVGKHAAVQGSMPEGPQQRNPNPSSIKNSDPSSATPYL